MSRRPRARRTAVPRDLTALVTEQDRLPPHYTSAFAVPVAAEDSRSPEQWARAVFEEAPAAVRWSMVTGWRLTLRLRLGSAGSPDHVLGWHVAGPGPRTITLTAPSPLITARNVVVVDATRVTWVTLVRHDHPLARWVWATAAPVHHLLIPYLLGRAANGRRTT
ncbi:DUF2867 domain-containing protein [Streptantibioticus parmotrematis]|uniref:DUF2867 domain-containing protein n=1 Tax=Streptantibioticus parmotrematis TaxID=2873249 RepID=UPI00207C0D44|nr:DUF2867 domain-containing protein [Streptantibioticus parmotrematis]